MLVNTWVSQPSSDCWLRCWWSVNLELTGFLIEMLVECWSSVDWLSIEMLIECRSRCRWSVDLVLIKMSMGHFPSIYCWLSIDWDVNQDADGTLMKDINRHSTVDAFGTYDLIWLFKPWCQHANTPHWYWYISYSTCWKNVFNNQSNHNLSLVTTGQWSWIFLPEYVSVLQWEFQCCWCLSIKRLSSTSVT